MLQKHEVISADNERLFEMFNLEQKFQNLIADYFEIEPAVVQAAKDAVSEVHDLVHARADQNSPLTRQELVSLKQKLAEKFQSLCPTGVYVTVRDTLTITFSFDPPTESIPVHDQRGVLVGRIHPERTVELGYIQVQKESLNFFHPQLEANFLASPPTMSHLDLRLSSSRVQEFPWLPSASVQVNLDRDESAAKLFHRSHIRIDQNEQTANPESEQLPFVLGENDPVNLSSQAFFSPDGQLRQLRVRFPNDRFREFTTVTVTGNRLVIDSTSSYSKQQVVLIEKADQVENAVTTQSTLFYEFLPNKLVFSANDARYELPLKLSYLQWPNQTLELLQTFFPKNSRLDQH